MQALIELKDVLIKLSMPGILGAFGGIAFYLYKISKGQDFKISAFIINIILAFFVGWTLQKFLPVALSQELASGLLAICGFLTFPILDYAETKGFTKLLNISNIEK